MLLSYQADKFTLAAEHLTSDDKGTDGEGTGGFGILKLGKFSPFARIERFDPDTNKNNDEHTRIIGGLNYKMADRVVVAADYQATNYKNSATTDTKALYLHMRVRF